VAEFEVDVGFIEGPTTEPRLTMLPWMQDELVVVCAPGHPLARGARKTVSIEALREETWLLRESGSGTREVVERALQPHLHRMRTGTELGSAEAIKQAVAEGLGIACLSKFSVADQVKLGRLVTLRTALPKLERTFHLVHHERRYLSPTLERFVAHCLGKSSPAGRPGAGKSKGGG
jgi:DNA-binding transcriptional LysR family regulator